MNKDIIRLAMPLILVFFISTLLLVAVQQFMQARGANIGVMMAGNLIVFLATISSVIIASRANGSHNPQVAVRSMYLSFMIKFFVIAIAAFAYIFIAKKEVNKPALIFCAAAYFVYTIIEVSTLTKMLKKKKDA